MKKYLWAASLLLFNSEIVSWLALLIIAGMGLYEFFREVDKAGGLK